MTWPVSLRGTDTYWSFAPSFKLLIIRPCAYGALTRIAPLPFLQTSNGIRALRGTYTYVSLPLLQTFNYSSMLLRGTYLYFSVGCWVDISSVVQLCHILARVANMGISTSVLRQCTPVHSLWAKLVGASTRLISQSSAIRPPWSTRPSHIHKSYCTL